MYFSNFILSYALNPVGMECTDVYEIFFKYYLDINSTVFTLRLNYWNRSVCLMDRSMFRTISFHFKQCLPALHVDAAREERHCADAQVN